MTISNYTELKATLADYLNRSDLTTRIVDFVTMAESDINTVSRLLQQETTASITMVANQPYNDLPSGFLDVVDFYYLESDDDTDDQLVQRPVKRLNEIRSSSPGMPRAYAISDRILYEYPPDAAYTPEMRYLKKWDIATDTTNWLLTNHPGAYLYGALVHAEPFLANDARMPMWKALAGEKIELLNDLSARTKGKATLRADDGLLRNRSGNILQGDY